MTRIVRHVIMVHVTILLYIVYAKNKLSKNNEYFTTLDNLKEQNEQLRAENMDYTKDMFGYQLGNIKAVPDSLSKTTAYTKNNKYFPFLEYYTCTEEEKNALKNKLKYNGMTVMAIGTISEYLKPEESYIKGRLIRLVGDYDNHYVNELSQELYKGVYI